MERPDLLSDDMEVLLVKMVDNADVISSALDILEKPKDAGIIDLMRGIVNDYLPTDVDFLAKFFSSKEFAMSLMKTLNILISLMGAMGSEKNSDMIKGLMYNAEQITDDMIDAVHDPKKYSPLKIGKLLSDDDIRVTLSALVAMMKSMGKILKKTAP